MASDILRTIKNRLRNTWPYRATGEVKCALDRNRLRRQSHNAKVVSLKPENPSGKNVLLCYIIDPFLLSPGQPVSTAHSHDWESLQIARTFLEMSYCVDVISFLNKEFVPEKEYSVVIDARYNLERWARSLPKSCLKIMHIDSAHIVYHDAAEANRLLDVQRRRRVTLRPRRWEMPNLCIEHADCATILGNEFTMDTFRYAGKPMYRVPISSPVLYPWPEEKDFAACRNRFLWLGSGGLIHKGLDLVLEAFAELPDYHLTVCGPISQERDFEKAYENELYGLPNIRTVGWVDIASGEFVEILQSCVGIVYPSCSEGGGGSVINCMHGGLIPVLSYESSVDVEEGYGVILKESTVSEIKNSVRGLSAFSPEKLENMARQSWGYVRANHTRENFAKTYREVIANLIAGGSAIPAAGEGCFVEAVAKAVNRADPDRRSC